MTNTTRQFDLPLWAKAGMGLVGFGLLLPFVVPALSLMLLAAIPVILGFIPWLAFQASSARTHRNGGSRRLPSPSDVREPIRTPAYSRPREAHA